MTRKTVAALGILVILLVSVFGTVGAQSGTDPDETPTVVPTTETEPTSTKFFTHPVVKLLSAYFDQDTEEEEVEPEEPTDPTVTETPDPANPDDTETGEEENESGLGPIGEEIAAYHEEGMGFGVLVKVYAMVKASEKACAAENEAGAPAEGEPTEGEPAEETCTPLTADELVTALKDGKGMGALFKEYGKPALLGVGHVKQELKKQQEAQQDGEQLTGEEEETEDEAVKGGKPDKEEKEKPGKLPKEQKEKKDKGPKK